MLRLIFQQFEDMELPANEALIILLYLEPVLFLPLLWDVDRLYSFRHSD